MNRRRFLALAAACASVAAPSVRAAAPTAPKRLVVVMLRGAVDGLSVVVPYGEDAYYEARPSIAIAKPDAPDGAGLALDGHFALHPALAGLMPLWRDKQLAFVHAAGSPDPTRSHFDAQFFMETGIPGKTRTTDGWMNRLLEALPGPRGPTDAVALGPTLPQILRGPLVVANLPLGPAASRALPIDQPEVARGFDRLYAGDDRLSRSYRQGRAARAELIANLPAEEAADAGAPPPNSLPAQAGRLAHLLTRDERIRLVFLDLGGWDTHVGQGNHRGQLADRLRPLGDGLASLAQALGRGWADTLVVAVSEFGRTVRENGDGGTDHGHGNIMWLAGGALRGGAVYGDWPSLAADRLYQGRDLAVTTDYRNVLATVAERHLRLPDWALDRIFPGLPPGPAHLRQLLAT